MRQRNREREGGGWEERGRGKLRPLVPPAPAPSSHEPARMPAAAFGAPFLSVSADGLAVEPLGTENQILQEKLGKRRILLAA
jgi:hypothetical protein